MQKTVDGLKQLARSEGFSDLRITAAVDARGFSELVQWLDAGYAGQMDYFQKRLDAYRHPQGVLEGVRSLAVMAYPYPASPVFDASPGHGKTARYTWLGEDYHDILHAKLKGLARFLSAEHPGCRVRGIVDTAPLLEREFAELAGIGWRAKNTLVINKYSGSYFFIACLLTDLELPLDQPHPTGHCGECRRCLDACPTQAFPSEGVLDATRCISYLTIELRDPIPEPLRHSIGDWVFGCDVCQEVCPWNQPPRLMRLRQPHVTDVIPEQAEIELGPLFRLDDEAFKQRFRKTPMWRVKRRGLLRNAAIVLGNSGDAASIPYLAEGLRDREPLVRAACVWALQKIGGEQACSLLAELGSQEQDPAVIAELDSSQPPH